MECEACGTTNREGAKFCMGCGSVLRDEPRSAAAGHDAPTDEAAPAGASRDSLTASHGAGDEQPVARRDPVHQDDNPWLTPTGEHDVASDVPAAGDDPAVDLPDGTAPGRGPVGVALAGGTPPAPTALAGLAASPPADASSGQADDPHGFAAAAMRLSPASRQAGFPALVVASISLDDDEQVQVMVQGVAGGVWGVALLTSTRVLVVTPRLWVPGRITIPLGPELSVKGWAEGGYASLTFDTGERRYAIEQIADTILAVELANRLRSEVEKRSSA